MLLLLPIGDRGSLILAARGCGLGDAAAGNMAAAKKVEDLDVYQLAVALRDEVLRLTETGRVSHDFRYRDQVRDAARSAPRNLAEGFSRFKPRLFAHSARIALGSLGEVIDELMDGRKQRYFSEEDADRLVKLAKRAAGATTRLIEYLDSCGREAPTGWSATHKLKRNR